MSAIVIAPTSHRARMRLNSVQRKEIVMHRFSALAVIAGLILVACGGGAPAGAPSGAPSSGPATSVAASPAASASPTSPASPSAPASTAATAAASPAAAGEIKVGTVLPITGAFATSGKYFQQGYQMAIDEVNAAG